MKKTAAILCNIMLFGFLLGIHEGQIAIWKDEDPKPAIILPYKAESLPIKDRIALKKGIRFDSIKDIEKLLQDYLT